MIKYDFFFIFANETIKTSGTFVTQKPT